MTKTTLTRKAAMVQGAVLAFLMPKLAQDAKIDLSPVLKGVAQKNYRASKPQIIAAIKSRTSGKLAQDADLEDLTALLDSLDEIEPEEGKDAEPSAAIPIKEEAKDAGSEALKEHLKGKLNDDDYAKACELMDDGASDEDETEEEKAAREAKEAEEAKAAKDKGAKDEGEKDDDKVTKGAMDSAIAAAVARATTKATETQVAIRDAERAVRPYVGELAMAFDSADAVYSAALGILGVDVADIHPSAFPALLKAQPAPSTRTAKPTVAMDAASAKSFAERHPDTARISVL